METRYEVDGVAVSKDHPEVIKYLEEEQLETPKERLDRGWPLSWAILGPPRPAYVMIMTLNNLKDKT